MTIGLLQAQSSITDRADKDFAKENYGSASEEYEKLLKKSSTPDEDRAYINFMIGECNRIEFLNYQLAESYYNAALDLGYSNPKVYLYLGDVTLKTGEYEKAKPFLERYLTYVPDDSEGQLKMKSCEFAIRNMKKLPDYEISNESTLNTDKREYSATYLPPGVTLQADFKKYSYQFEVIPEFFYDKVYFANMDRSAKARLVFTSSREESANRNVDFAITDQIYEVLYDKRDERWGEPKELQGGINSSRNNVGIFSYNEANKIGYFQRCNSPLEAKRYCNIYYSIYDENSNTWSEAKVFDFETEDYIIGHPNLSGDAKTLFFASNKPGGFGGSDLYMSRQDAEGKWSEPLNIGAVINTPYNETFPFMKGDSVLYFSSNGLVGMGGDDVFSSKVTIIGDTWYFSEPKNLGFPINSTADDFAIIFTNPMNGFFCSNRNTNDSKGSDDIFSFKKKPKAFIVKGNVRDQYSKNFDKVKVVLTGSDGSRYEVTTDSLGNYVFNDEKLTSDVKYEVTVLEDDYLSEKNQIKTDTTQLAVNTDTVTTQPIDTVDVSNNNVINVIKYNRDGETEIQNIYWDFDKWFLRQISKEELQKIARILNGDPTNYIIINSYADEQGTFDYNKILSHRRAKTVVEFLIQAGVDKNRLLGRGFGESQLVVKNAHNDSEHQQNRRTTFEVKTRDEFVEYLAFAGIYSQKSKAYSQYLSYYGDLVANADFGERNEIEFRVQFIATREPIDETFYKKIEQNIPNEPINFSLDPDGYYRYSVGKYISIEQAQATERKLRSLGYDTYVVAFNNGLKISVKQAEKLIKNG